MTKQERYLLKKLAGSYAFIVALRSRAVERVDIEFIKTTAGIEKAIKEMDELYPRLFARYVKLAQKKASEYEQTKIKERQTQGATPKRKAKRKSEEKAYVPRTSK